MTSEHRVFDMGGSRGNFQTETPSASSLTRLNAAFSMHLSLAQETWLNQILLLLSLAFCSSSDSHAVLKIDSGLQMLNSWVCMRLAADG